MMNNHIRCVVCDVITHPCHTFNTGLLNPPWKLARMSDYISLLYVDVIDYSYNSRECYYVSIPQSQNWFNLIHGGLLCYQNFLHGLNGVEWCYVQIYVGALLHYDDVIMGAMASQITSLTILYSTVYSDSDQRKHQSFASLAFVRGIHRWPVNSPHKWPVTVKMFLFDDVIMEIIQHINVEWRSFLCKTESSCTKLFASNDDEAEHKTTFLCI